MGLSHSPKIVTDGLVSYLDAANPKSYPGSGTTWSDLSGNGNNATLVNGPTYSTGSAGSIVFDGVNDYGTLSSADPFKIDTMTIEVVAVLEEDINSSSGFKGFFSTFSISAGYQLFWHASSQYFYFFAGGAIRISTISFTNGTFTSGDFLHLVCRFGTSDYESNDIFVNNVNQTNFRHTTPSIGHSTYSPWIGGRNVSDTYYLNQNMSIVRFYNRKLTDSEIKQNFEATRGRFNL